MSGKVKVGKPVVNIQKIEQGYSYTPELFVDRARELQLVEKRIKEAQARSASEPLINFWGVEGIGKSWILRHLRHLYRYDANRKDKLKSLVLYYQMPGRIKHIPVSFSDLTVKFANQAIEQLKGVVQVEDLTLRLQESQESGFLPDLVKTFRHLAEDFVLILLLDETEHVSPEDWARIEDELFEPLLKTNRVVIVIAGRKQAPRWKKFEVRRRLAPVEKTEVKPFGQKEVEEQFEKRNFKLPSSIGLLFPYTAGNPKLAEAVAWHMTSWAEGIDSLDRKQLYEQFGQNLAHILREAENQMLKDVPAELREVLVQLFPLRHYRLEAMRFMLSDNLTDWRYLKLLKSLESETGVVWWDHDPRAYVTSKVIRQVMGQRWMLEDREAFCNQHQQAIKMYAKWAEETPAVSEEYIVEIWFHLASQAQIDGDGLPKRIFDWLDFAEEKLNKDRRLILQRQVEADEEILSLLPVIIREELLENINKLLPLNEEVVSQSKID